MYHCGAGLVRNHSNLQWTAVGVGTDEERDRRIVGLEGSPVMS